ncbi:hypothetical protein U91I_03602 [alpha proteobacterium U9-1i]|nr:hypothetical protein U91I_03602 [alpha proteobacterium U9-1i]
MNKRLAALALAFTLVAATASAQVQRLPTLPPTEQQQRAQDAIRRQQADEAARAAEAERQRLEQINREAEAERNRVHAYNFTCRVTQIIVRASDLTISCDEVRNRLRNTGSVYTGTAIRGSTASIYVDYAASPAFATMAAEVAAISYADRSRLRIESITQPNDNKHWLTQISIDRGEGCSPACPP